MSNMIRCPKCSHAFEATTAMSDTIRAELEAQFKAEADAITRRAAETVASANARLESELAGKLRAERERAQAAAKADAAAELDAARAEAEDVRTKLANAQKAELDLRRQQRELEAAKSAMELEVARKLDAERARIRDEVASQASDQHAMKQAEWEKTRADLLRQVDDMRRKAEQGSQQSQGEVFELAIETALRDAFPDDSIEEVAKGVKGGDVTQHVQTRGVLCGKILWELKRTKVWSHGWVPKLKEDKRTSGSDVAVIVTTAMPEGVKTIGCIDGVWVSDPHSFLGLAAALRTGLTEAERVKASFSGRKDKLDALYDYVNGPDFRNNVTSLVEAFVAMREDLEAEKRAMDKLWSKREKMLARGVSTVAVVYGGMQGLVPLQNIPQLELGA